MKKVAMLAVAAALLGISAPNFAQVPGSSQPSSTQQDDRDQDVGTSGSQSGSPSGTSTGTQQPGTSGSQSGTGTGTTGTGTGTMSQYSEEVEISDLPASVSMTLSEDYPGYKAEKAYKANDGTFKVTMKKDGEEKQTLFFDQKGEVIKTPKSKTGSSTSGSGTGTSGSGTGTGSYGTSPQQPGTSGSQSGTGTGTSSGTGSQTGTGTSGTSTQQDKDHRTSGSGTSTSGSGTGTSGSATGTGAGSSSGSMSSEYNEEVKTSELPAAITRSLNEKYPGYKTDKAHKAKDGTYKVTVSKGDEKQTLFFDARGESVKMQK